MKLECETQPDLAFSAGQGLRDSAERCSLGLLNLNGGRIGIVKQIKEFEKALDFEAITDGPGFSDAQIHVNEMRSNEGIAARFQVAAVKRAIRIHIDRLLCDSGIAEAALGAEQAAELNLPRQFHEAVKFEGVTQSQIGRAAVEFRSIAQSGRHGYSSTITSREGMVCVRLTSASAGAGIGDNRYDSP